MKYCKFCSDVSKIGVKIYRFYIKKAKNGQMGKLFYFWLTVLKKAKWQSCGVLQNVFYFAVESSQCDRLIYLWRHALHLLLTHTHTHTKANDKVLNLIAIKKLVVCSKQTGVVINVRNQAWKRNIKRHSK